jgi:molybdopterin converting factor small subunit
MGITLNFHKTHRQFTQGRHSIEVDGRTVGECLYKMVEMYPDMQDILFGNQGRLRHEIEIYLNMASTFPDELSTPVQSGDEIHITMMLAGG